ncbi:unnamed protein product [Aphis gossypii]|uniref:Uncharacterized protein n=1 Tax=Aphis gossypii TaxID=80765 RepID=A0A9P0IZP2_APHGO|nr:unnamed protein product [Aphis gossypii]
MKQTIEVLTCEIFLMDFIEFTKEELKEKTSTFRWVKYVNDTISMSSIMVLNKTKEFKEVLQGRIKKFNIDLNIYRSEIDDFRHLGDINEIKIYAEKSQNLDDKLTEALETIDDFNKQEKYFQMEESAYPLRKFISDSLAPYKLLYDNCSEFIVNYEKWMNATIGTYDPEQIDQNVTNYYRNLTKLERTFMKSPAPLAIATTRMGS